MATRSRPKPKGPPPEWKETVDYWVEEKLAQMLGDPDEGRQVMKSLRDRLTKSRKARGNGLKGPSPEEFLNKHAD